MWTWMRQLWRRLIGGDRLDQALDDEIRSYVDLAADERQLAGAAPDEARRAALADVGGVTQVKEATRAVWPGSGIGTVARECRYALRSLTRSPGYLTAALATLSLGIGGATAIFTIIKASLLAPLPAVGAPDRLVSIERVQSQTPDTIAEFSYPDYVDLRDRARTLIGLAAYNGTPFVVTDSAGETRVMGSYVSGDFFSVLSVAPEAGRLLAPTDTTNVAVIGDALWRQRLGAAPGVVGSTIRIDGTPYTVVGVAPPGFIGAMAEWPMDFWIPVAGGGRVAPPLRPYEPDGYALGARAFSWLRLVGRLAPGASVDDAQQDLETVAQSLATTYATNRGRSVRVFAGAGMAAEERTDLSRIPTLLATAVGLLLVIACANVATLALVRLSGRRHEFATRVALGASRSALMRQAAIEGVVVAAGAAALGLTLARLLVRQAALVRTVTPLASLDLGFDGRVFAVAAAAAIVTALLVSALPAIEAARVPPGAVLKDGRTAGRRAARGQRLLVAGQIGLSLILLSTAAIIASAFHRTIDAHASADPAHVTAAGLNVMATLDTPPARAAFYDALLVRAAAAPDVQSVALGSTVPPFQWADRATIFRQGEEPPADALVTGAAGGLRTFQVAASGSFFETTRLRLLRGRTFAPTDVESAPHVTVVSRGVAETLWPNADPLGRCLARPRVEGSPRPPVCVIGVVEDMPALVPSAPRPLAIYVAYTQAPRDNLSVIVRTGHAALTPQALADLVRTVDARVRVDGSMTLSQRIEDATGPQRVASQWVGAFGAIALLLAGIGLYGVTAQRVAQRTREIALRSALGASRGDIRSTIFADGFKVALMGAALGLVVGAVLFRWLASQFTGIEIVDVRLATAALVALVVTSMTALYIPARRAARLDPIVALRGE